MGLWTKEQLRQFIKENKLVSAMDAQNALKELFAETIQEMLVAEMDTHLGFRNSFSDNGGNTGRVRLSVMRTIVDKFMQRCVIR
jgi:putative transposase